MNSKLNRIIQYAAVATIIFVIACGFAMTFWEIRPFFLDEWAVIYNLKYKTLAETWGTMEKIQQFPRLYLYIFKWWSSAFNFSYISLRLPSFIVHTIGLVYCIYLSGKLFREQPLYKWLWVLIYAAYPASVFYYVLTKQYTMEMLLALAGIAQLALLVNINQDKGPSCSKYILLCLSFLIAPMFSYTYPIVVAPVYAIVFFNTISKGRNLWKQWLPMLLCTIGIITLYIVDIQQVMLDPGMKNYWKDYYMTSGFSLKELCYHIFMYFYNFGRGSFMAAIGILGLIAWLFSSYKSVAILKKREKTLLEWLVVYSASLMWLSVLLFIAGKLPLNAYRLNAYKTPATGIMIIYLFLQLQQNLKLIKPVYAAAGFLLALQILFIVQPFIRELAESEHKRKMLIYNNAKTAIATAQQSATPMAIFTTSMTLYPHNDIDQADWVIKSYPLYDKEKNIPVYPINTGNDADSLLSTLPYSSVVVTVGDSVFIVEK